jgi:transposase
MTREEKIAEARKLRERDQDLGCTAIARRLGVTAKTVRRWLDPKFDAQVREWNAASRKRRREHRQAYDRQYAASHKRECPSCGGEMTRGTTGICKACIDERVHARGLRVEELWAEGLSRSEIADRLGVTVNQLSVELHQFRERGYRLPYRYSLRKPTFSEQVAA